MTISHQLPAPRPAFPLARLLALGSLAAASLLPAAGGLRAAPPLLRADEPFRTDDGARPAGSRRPWWPDDPIVAATAPAGPQNHAILVPNDTAVPINALQAGRSVALSGSIGLVGASANSQAVQGGAYVFRGGDTAMGMVAQSVKLAGSDSGAGDNYGIAVSLAGTTAMVGAPQFSTGIPGSVYLFRNLDTATGTVNQNAKLAASDGGTSANLFGQSLAQAGNVGLVGAPYANGQFGAGYLFRNLDTATGTVTQNVKLTASDPVQAARVGTSVSLSGNTALLGSPSIAAVSYVGAGYLFRNLDTATGTVTQNAKLQATDGTNNDAFGAAVSLSGSIGLIGASRAVIGSNTLQGAAYVFRGLDTATGTVTQNAKLQASDGAASNAFGTAVSLSGTTALVGAPNAAVNGVANAGAVYLFRNLDTASGTVTQNVKITPSTNVAQDRFGTSITQDGDRFLIGAIGTTSGPGKTYTGTTGSMTTLDAGNRADVIGGFSFVSQDDWIIGQNTNGNQVTLSAGDMATVNAAGKGVFIGRNAGSNKNTLVIAGTVAANTFTIGNAASPGSANTLQLGDGGTAGSLPVAATINNSGILAFNRSNAVVQGTDFSGAALTGAGGVNQLGTGTTTLNAANTYTGATQVNAGTLRAGIASVADVSGAFGRNSAVAVANVAGATLDLNGFNTQIGSLAGGGTTGGNVTLGSATLTIGGNNASPAGPYAGTISGTGGLTKIGTGTQFLSGANTYTGATAVNGGTLAVNGSLAGPGLLTVASGAALAGGGTIAGAVAVQAGGTFAPGQPVTGKLTLQNSLALTGAATATFTLGGTVAGTGYSQAQVAGQVTLGTAATLTLNLANGFVPAMGSKFYVLDQTGTQVAVLGSFANAPLTGSVFTSNGVQYQVNYADRDPADTSNALPNDISVTVVPEPGTWGLAAAGAGLLGVALRQRRRTGRA